MDGSTYLKNKILALLLLYIVDNKFHSLKLFKTYNLGNIIKGVRIKEKY